MTYASTFKPSKDGNSVETQIVIANIEYDYNGKTIPAERVLTIRTSKDSYKKVLKVSASVSTDYMSESPHGAYKCSTHAFSFGNGGDYSKTVVTGGAKPATEKNLRALHDSSMQSVHMLLDDVNSHYAAKA